MDQNSNAINNSPVPASPTPSSDAVRSSGPEASTAPPPTPTLTPTPAVIGSGEPGKPKVFVATGSHKKAFMFGALAVLLFIGLGASLFLVQKNQDIRSKASQFGSGWPKNPSPSDGQTGVELSPIFKWDYETQNNTSCNPTGSYANVYLWDCAAHNDGCKIGFGGRSSDTQSVYEVPSTVMHPYSSGVLDYSRSVAPLAPNKQYWWYVTPKACGVLHFEENKAWSFTTGNAPPVNSASCQMVSADKDLAKIKIGDTVKFTGYGSVSSVSEKIDKINFILTKDSAQVSSDTIDAVRALDKDSGGNQFYVATRSAVIDAAGSYSMRIRVHWQSADRWLE